MDISDKRLLMDLLERADAEGCLEIRHLETDEYMSLDWCFEDCGVIHLRVK